MISSLSKQLDSLREKDSQLARVNEKRQATVIFDPKEAGKIDIDQIQSMAIEGYHNLSSILPGIVEFQDMIIEQQYTDRMKTTQAENEQLSTRIRKLLRELSKNFLNTNCLKILEYLLRHYQIHIFEADYLVIAFLAYHSTAQYTKLIQNVDLSQKTSRLTFLNSYSLTGQPVPRDIILRQVQLDFSILESYREIFSEGLLDKTQTSSIVFVSKSLSQGQAKPPTLAFLVSLLEEALDMGSRRFRDELRLSCIKLIKSLSLAKKDEEGFSAILIVLSSLISNKFVDGETFSAIFEEVAQQFVVKASPTSQNAKSYSLTLAKVLILAFQKLSTLDLTHELFSVIQSHLLESILSSRVRLVQFGIKICIYYCKHSKGLEELRKVLSAINLKDHFLSERNCELLRFILVCFTQGMEHKRATKDLNSLLKEVFGQKFYDALSFLLTVEDISQETRTLVEALVSESLIHRLVAVKDYSKMTLITALHDSNHSLKREALKLLLEADEESLSQSHIYKEVLVEFTRQYNPEVLTELLKFPWKQIALNEDEEFEFLYKYLEVDNQAVKNAIRISVSARPGLKKIFNLLDIAEGKGKPVKYSDWEDSSLFERTLSALCKYISKVSNLSIPTLLNSAFSQRLYLPVYSSLAHIKSLGNSQLQEIYKHLLINFDSQMTSLDASQFTSALKIIWTLQQTFSNQPYEPKNPSDFLKMSLVILFSDGHTVDNITLQAISQILSNLKSISLQGIAQIDHMLLLLLFKGLHNDQLKNGHFLKILQTVRFAIKEEGNLPGLQLFKHLLKKLLIKKFEWESGGFSGFEKEDMKSIQTYLSDSKVNAMELFKGFFQFCLDNVAFYPEMIQFSSFLGLLRNLPNQLPEYLTSILTKISTSSELCTSVIRSLFDLYCHITSEKSQIFETQLSRSRSLADTSFDYLSAKSSYAGFLELVEIYLETNFKNKGLISEMRLTSSQLVQISRSIFTRHHEGLTGIFCSVLKSHCEAAKDITMISGLLISYRFLYESFLTSKFRKEDVEIEVVTALTEIYKLIQKSDSVKLLEDRSKLKGATTHFSLQVPHDKKHHLVKHIQLETIEENKVPKLIVTGDYLTAPDIYQFLEKKSQTSVEKLVMSRAESIAADHEDQTLEHFQFVKSVIEYLLVPNKSAKQQIDSLLHTILTAFVNSTESAKAKLRGQESKKSKQSVLDLEKHGDIRGQTMLTKLHHEVDYLLQLIIKIVATQFGHKKLKLCSEILLFWLILSERHRGNSLMRVLTNFYQKAMRKGLKEVNPLTDPDIFYYSRYLKNLTNDVFGVENTDVVLGNLVVLFLFVGTVQADEKELSFVKFCHFMLAHLLDRQIDIGESCSKVIQTLTSSVANLKGLLPSNSKKATKRPKVIIIKDFLRRDDPLVSQSNSSHEKIRSMRYCLIFLSFVNMIMKERRFNRYLKVAVEQQQAISEVEGSIKSQLEQLLLEIFKFEVDFETQEKGYQNHSKTTKPGVIALFSKIRKLCSLNMESVAKLLPAELFPRSITTKLSQDPIDFDILLRLTLAMNHKIGTHKITTGVFADWEHMIEKFISQSAVFTTLTTRAHAVSKFIQNIFLSMELFHQNNPSKAEKVILSHMEVLLEIAAAQTTSGTLAVCLRSLSVYSRGSNETFLILLDKFMGVFEKLAVSSLSVLNHEQSSLLTKHTKIAGQKKLLPSKKAADTQSKSIAKEIASREALKVWLAGLRIIAQNMTNMIEPYIVRIWIYLGFGFEWAKELRSEYKKTADSLVAHIDERNLIEPLLEISKALENKVWSLETTDLLTHSMTKISRDDFVDNQTSLFKLAREICGFRNELYSSAIESYLQDAVKLISQFAMKSSETTFKSHFDSLIKWSKLTHDYESTSPEMMERKISVILVVWLETIGKYGIVYYGFVYDYFVGFLEHCQGVLKLQNGGKRSTPIASEQLVEIHPLILRSLDLLFQNDKRGFMDSLHFEKIVKPLTQQLSLEALSEDFFDYALQNIVPSIMSLTSLMNDDFMWKTILYNICTQIRHSSPVVRKLVVHTSVKFIDLLAEKFITVLNDFIPFLSQMLEDEDPEVFAAAKGIVNQLSQYTTEDIYAMIKATY